MVKSARLIASGKHLLTNLLLEHIIPRSVVAVGNIEQIRESPSRLITNGQQMVASPIVAASKGTGMIERTCRQQVISCQKKTNFGITLST
jgi:hypothetical protein